MEDYEKQFLQKVSKKINAETDYTANYGDTNVYFVGHQFLERKWNFVFVYRRYH